MFGAIDGEGAKLRFFQAFWECEEKGDNKEYDSQHQAADNMYGLPKSFIDIVDIDARADDPTPGFKTLDVR